MNRSLEKIAAFLGRRWYVVMNGLPEAEDPVGRFRTREGARRAALHLTCRQSVGWNEAKARLLGDPPGFRIELR